MKRHDPPLCFLDSFQNQGSILLDCMSGVIDVPERSTPFYFCTLFEYRLTIASIGNRSENWSQSMRDTRMKRYNKQPCTRPWLGQQEDFFPAVKFL